MDNELIKVSAAGVSVGQATGTNVLFSTQAPFAKLDSTNPVSFQNIVVFLSNEPPAPAKGGTPIPTQIYQFAHGYTYVPSYWFMLQFYNPLSTVPGYGYEGSELNYSLGTGGIVDYAYFEVVVDNTNVTFYVNKTNFGGSPASVVGFFLHIRSYIFVEDLLGDSIPTQP